MNKIRLNYIHICVTKIKWKREIFLKINKILMLKTIHNINILSV